MSIRKIKLQNGETRWELRYYLNGRRSKRIKRIFHTKVDAETEWDRSRLRKREQVLGTFQGDLKFSEMKERWLEANQHRFSKSHLVNIQTFSNRIAEDLGHLSLQRVTADTLLRIQSKLLSENLSAATVNRHTQMILSVLNFAVHQRALPFNPAAGFKKLKESREAVSFWEKNEIEAFLKFANDKYPKNSAARWVFAVYLAALNTAARAGELWGLMPQDLQQDGEIIVIQRQFNKATNDFGPTKGRRVRRVPCNSHLREELQGLITNRKIYPTETIFQNSERKPISHDNFVKRVFAQDLKDWGGRRIRFHDLRHTATTQMIASGVDLKTVQEICGHEKIETTMNYVHLLSERIRETARSFALLPSV